MLEVEFCYSKLAVLTGISFSLFLPLPLELLDQVFFIFYGYKKKIYSIFVEKIF